MKNWRFYHHFSQTVFTVTQSTQYKYKVKPNVAKNNFYIRFQSGVSQRTMFVEITQNALNTLNIFHRDQKTLFWGKNSDFLSCCTINPDAAAISSEVDMIH